MSYHPDPGIEAMGREIQRRQQEYAAFAAAQAQREAEEQARAVVRALWISRANSAADKARQANAVCVFAHTTAAGQDGTQPVAAIARCEACAKYFCADHRSIDRHGDTPLSHQAYSAQIELCVYCQSERIARDAGQKRRQMDEESRRNEARRVAAAEAERREDRQHAERRARREAKRGWDASLIRVAELDSKISRIKVKNTIGPAAAAGCIALLLGLCITLAVALNGLATGHDQTAGFCFFLSILLFFPGVFAITALVGRVRQVRREGMIEERARLMKNRGCGVAGCSRCSDSLAF